MSESSARTHRDRRAEATRALLIRTALRLFAERGYAATSTRSIAQAAGVSEGLIFHHFETKRDLLLTIVDSEETMASRIEALVEDAEDMSVAEFCAAISDGFVELMAPRRPLARMFRLLIGESLVVPELAELFRRKEAELTKGVGTYLSARVEAGEVDASVDTRSAALALFGMFFWFFHRRQNLGAKQWQREAKRYADQAVEIWERGLRE